MKLVEYLNKNCLIELDRSSVQSLRIRSELVYINEKVVLNDEYIDGFTKFNEMENIAELLIDGNWYAIGLFYSADNSDYADDLPSRIRIHEMFINDLDDGCDTVNISDSTDLIGDCIEIINSFRRWNWIDKHSYPIEMLIEND
tara:strand:+ start:75 stop:503 length:429 start_codon:yes stop_codon:yes gene_type:complete